MKTTYSKNGGKRRNWTREETIAVVALYFQMATLEQDKTPFKKAPLVREVMAETNRSKGSVEAKLMNVSGAIVALIASGDLDPEFPMVTGYAPLGSFSKDLPTLLLECLGVAQCA